MKGPVVTQLNVLTAHHDRVHDDHGDLHECCDELQRQVFAAVIRTLLGAARRVFVCDKLLLDLRGEAALVTRRTHR